MDKDSAQPLKITARIPFTNSHYVPSLGEEDVIGAVSQDGYWLWLAKEAYLEVFIAHSAERCGSWQFGTQRPLAAISAVTEVSPSLLGVAVTWGACPYSQVCLLDLSCFKVVRAVELQCRITSMCRVPAHPVEATYHPLLTLLSGAVALGTDEGRVLFLDLVSPDRNFSDESCPEQPGQLSLQSNRSSVKRKELGSAPYLLALNEDHLSRDTFHYLSPSGDSICKYFSRGAGVTCLEYFPRIGMLGVGYIFGGFQLWDLHSLHLVFSFTDTKDIPVVKFALQKPENDPRHQVYLWVFHGFTKRTNDMSLVQASLHSLYFKHKEWKEDFGYIYKNLDSCDRRLKYYLGPHPWESTYPHNRPQLGSKLTSCTTIHKPDHSVIGPGAINADVEESLCIFSWQVYDSPSDIRTPCNYLAIFDLNQWYQAQMPSSFRYSSKERIPFLGIYSLAELAPYLEGSPLVDVHLVSRSLARFSSLECLEEHNYPSSLSFQVLCFSDKGIIKGSFLGMQRQVLAELSNLGPLALLDQQSLYQHCKKCALLEDIEPYTAPPHLSVQETQREQLLTLALVHGMFRFLTLCLREWAVGDLAAEGCTLLFFSNWAWRRVTSIKEAIDTYYTTPIGLSTEKSVPRKFRSYLRQLETLTTLFTMLPEAGPITEKGRADLRTKLDVTQSIAAYLKANLLLTELGNLPQSDYPTDHLKQFYVTRRRALSDSWGPLLMADRLWKEAGRSYPPESLEAGLAVYLQLGLTLEAKHRLFIYLLIDLQRENVVFFPDTLLNGVRALWHLDHGNFQKGVELLMTKGATQPELTRCHQEAIVRALMRQGHSQLALQLCLTHRLPCTSQEHVLLQMDLLLNNQKVMEAFYFQRNYRDMEHSVDFLKHFYHTCHKMSMMEPLLRLPLDEYEERELVKFLTGPELKSGQELLVLYFLQKSRPLEVARLVARLPNNDERCEVRRDLISCYLRALPQAQKNLALSVTTKSIKMPAEKWQPRTPTRLPIRKLGLPVCSKASLLEHIVSRVSTGDHGKSGLPDGLAEPPYIGSPFKQLSRPNKGVATCFPAPLSAAKRALEASTLDSPIKRVRCLEDQMNNEEVLKVLQVPPRVQRNIPPVQPSTPSIIPSSILKTPVSLAEDKRRKLPEATKSKESSTPRVSFKLSKESDPEEKEGTVVQTKSSSSKKVNIVYPTVPTRRTPPPTYRDDQLSDVTDDLSIQVEAPSSEENSVTSEDYIPFSHDDMMGEDQLQPEAPLSEPSSVPSTPEGEFSPAVSDISENETAHLEMPHLEREEELPMDFGGLHPSLLRFSTSYMSSTVSMSEISYRRETSTTRTEETSWEHKEVHTTTQEQRIPAAEEEMPAEIVIQLTEAQPEETESTEIEAQSVEIEAQSTEIEAQPVETYAQPVETEAQPMETEASPAEIVTPQELMEETPPSPEVTKPPTPPPSKKLVQPEVSKTPGIQTRSHRTKPPETTSQPAATLELKTPAPVKKQDVSAPAVEEDKPTTRLRKKAQKSPPKEDTGRKVKTQQQQPSVVTESSEKEVTEESSTLPQTSRTTRAAASKKKATKDKEDGGAKKEEEKEEDKLKKKGKASTLVPVPEEQVSSPNIIQLALDSSSSKTALPSTKASKEKDSQETTGLILSLNIPSIKPETSASKTPASTKSSRAEEKRATTPPPAPRSPEPRTARGRSSSPRGSRKLRLTPIKPLPEERVRRSTRLSTTPRRRDSTDVSSQSFQPPPGIPEEPEEEEEELPAIRTTRLRRSRLLHPKSSGLEPVSEAAEESEKEKEDRLALDSDGSPSKESHTSSETGSTYSSKQECFIFSHPTTPPGPHPPVASSSSDSSSFTKFIFSPPNTRSHHKQHESQRPKRIPRRRTASTTSTTGPTAENQEQERHHSMTLRTPRNTTTTPLK